MSVCQTETTAIFCVVRLMRRCLVRKLANVELVEYKLHLMCFASVCVASNSETTVHCRIYIRVDAFNYEFTETC